MSLDVLGSSAVKRDQRGFVESEAVRDSDLHLVVTRARATVEGKRVDLIKSYGLSLF
jgi:hypothetical protein